MAAGRGCLKGFSPALTVQKKVKSENFSTRSQQFIISRVTEF
jgi:hypothetical protein